MEKKPPVLASSADLLRSLYECLLNNNYERGENALLQRGIFYRDDHNAKMVLDFKEHGLDSEGGEKYNNLLSTSNPCSHVWK